MKAPEPIAFEHHDKEAVPCHDIHPRVSYIFEAISITKQNSDKTEHQ